MNRRVLTVLGVLFVLILWTSTLIAQTESEGWAAYNKALKLLSVPLNSFGNDHMFP